jgi:serine/threonine-protein kinase
MRRILSIGLVVVLSVATLVLSVASADARRRHKYYRMHRAPVMMVIPPMEAVRGARGRDSSFIPADWKLQPADPNFNGRRYIAPDGSAWLALYSAEASKDALAAHLKSVAFADGEDVTYLRGARDWLAVSGLKGDRVYYRKVVLACGGTMWRHMAFEYPAQAKPVIDRMVERAAQTLDRLAEESCGGDMFTHPKT